MSPSRADSELDELIADAIVDAYDQDEALMGFENAFDEEGCLPCPATILANTVELLSVSTAAGRQELVATCRHTGHHHRIALLDIDIDADQPASCLLAAYRRWTGAEAPTT
ncbi:MAG: hypothetical protein LC777_01975 [Actinobacteria bacterium]|nr:hypothetical protein [Actinomycetota bacterium]